MSDGKLTREDAEALGLIPRESPEERAAREAQLERLAAEAAELRRQIEAVRTGEGEEGAAG